jgi:hypothetical protein
MELKVLCKPSIVTGRSISEVKDKMISRYVYSVGTYATGWVNNTISHEDEEVILFNIVKKKGKIVRNRKGKYVKVSPNLVTGYYYRISINLLRAAKLKAVQGVRTFTICHI